MVVDTGELAIEVDWEPAEGVTSSELAGTWARIAIEVNDVSVTRGERSRGTSSRSLFVSAYPLAEWIAANWWLLDSGCLVLSQQSATWQQHTLPVSDRQGNLLSMSTELIILPSAYRHGLSEPHIRFALDNVFESKVTSR